MKATAGLSGVSGGMLGLGNYTTLSNHPNDPNIKDKIDAIALYNFLSIDLTMALGHDLALEYIPSYQSMDRAKIAMSKYAELTEQEIALEISFHDFWDSVRIKNGHYPALFVNSTSTKGTQATAPSLNMPPPVPGSENFLSRHDSDKQLTYYHTLSTSNRFPVLSPAGRVKKVGHYVDGGYFENSGMLTIYHFYKELKKESHDTYPPVFINIINGKEEYIKWWLQNEYDGDPEALNLQDETVSGEWNAILGTLTSLNKFPNYIRNKLGHEMIDIPLPYPITYEEVISILGGEIMKPAILMREIEKHNQNIRKILADNGNPYDIKNGIVTPSLARLQSQEVLDHQKAMLESKKIKEIIEKVLEVNGILE